MAAPAQAGKGADSRTLTVIGSDAVLGLGDVGTAGNSPGDVRTLSLALRSTKGEPVGRAEIVQTLTRQADGVGTAVKHVVLNLPKGSVIGMGTTQFTDFLSPTARPDDRTERIAIVGGTGAFVDANGTMDIVVLPEFTSRWTLRYAVPSR